MIGKARPALTSISTDPASVTLRGRNLTAHPIGGLTYSEYFFLLLAGLGFVPTNQMTRMNSAADPGSLQGAVVAGIPGCGPVVPGTADFCGKFLLEEKIVTAETAPVGCLMASHAGDATRDMPRGAA